jgi:nucleotide-binding universal stress UspA family protein
LAETEDYQRKYLVIIDDSPECSRAVTYAAYRARRVGGGIVFLALIDTADFQQFLGVEEVMRAEALEDAERLIDTHLAKVRAIDPAISVETLVREGRGTAPIEDVIAQDRNVAILVLAASSSGEGPLIAAFGQGGGGLHIPVTIIPGAMTDAEIQAVS